MFERQKKLIKDSLKENVPSDATGDGESNSLSDSFDDDDEDESVTVPLLMGLWILRMSPVQRPL